MRFTSVFVGLSIASVALTRNVARSPVSSNDCELYGGQGSCEGLLKVRDVATVAKRAPVTGVANIKARQANNDDDDDDDDVNDGIDDDHNDDDHNDDDHNDDHDDDDDDHNNSVGTLPPSPTGSINCEPHGDHWDCAGPRTTPGGSSTTSVVMTTTQQTQTLGSSTITNTALALTTVPTGAAATDAPRLAVGLLALAAPFVL